MRFPSRLPRSVFFGIATAVLVLGLLSCKKKEEAPAPVSAPAPEKTQPQADSETAREQGAEVPARKRKIIINHEISLEVKYFPAALEAITRLAETSGGYVVKSTHSGDNDGDSGGYVSLRVPTGSASGVMKAIRGLGRVENESSTAQDITDEYVDLEARLANARASEARLMELFRRAGKLDDVLAVEKELTRVRGDIESYQAKKKNWDILTEMVTIEVHLDSSSAGFPSGHRFWGSIKGAFGKSVVLIADSFHSLILFVAVILPWLVVFGPIAYLVVKRRRKKRQQEASVRENRPKAED